METGKIIVKELCAKTSSTCNFDGTLCTKSPIKEIYEVRHKIMKPRVIVGEKVCALFGKILIKAYCIKEESHELFLAEKMFNYKMFIFRDLKSHVVNPSVTVCSRLEGIFTEITQSDSILIDGTISAEISFSIEKELPYSECLDWEENPECKADLSTDHMQTGPEYSVFHLDGEDCIKESEEFIAEVRPGCEQELTIILD